MRLDYIRLHHQLDVALEAFSAQNADDSFVSSGEKRPNERFLKHEQHCVLQATAVN